MFGLSLPHLLLIAVIALVFIGPEQLPEVARMVGRFLNDLKRSTNSLTDDLKQQVRFDLQEKQNQYHNQQNQIPHNTSAEPILTPDQHDDGTIFPASSQLIKEKSEQLSFPEPALEEAAHHASEPQQTELTVAAEETAKNKITNHE